MPQLSARDLALLERLKPGAIVIDRADLTICDVCGKKIWVGQGKQGFAAYTVRRRGKRFITTRGRKHFPSYCNVDKWMER